MAKDPNERYAERDALERRLMRMGAKAMKTVFGHTDVGKLSLLVNAQYTKERLGEHEKKMDERIAAARNAAAVRLEEIGMEFNTSVQPGIPDLHEARSRVEVLMHRTASEGMTTRVPTRSEAMLFERYPQFAPIIAYRLTHKEIAIAEVARRLGLSRQQVYRIEHEVNKAAHACGFDGFCLIPTSVRRTPALAA